MGDETPAERWRLVRGADIQPSLRLTLYALNCFQGKNATAFCKRETLADEVGVHVDQLSRKLQALEKLGVIKSTWTKRNDRPSREHSIDFELLRKKQRSTLMNSSECDDGTLTFSTVHSDEFVSPTLMNSSDMNIQGTSKNIQKGASLPEVQFPEPLNNEEFRLAWSEWTEFRREIKKKLTPSTVSKQLKELSEWGSAKAIQAINNSIRNGWQGLFDPVQRPGQAATGSVEAEQAWQTVLDSVQKHSRFNPDKIMGDVGERAWQALRTIGLKQLDEAGDKQRIELKAKFMKAYEQVKP